MKIPLIVGIMVFVGGTSEVRSEFMVGSISMMATIFTMGGTLING